MTIPWRSIIMIVAGAIAMFAIITFIRDPFGLTHRKIEGLRATVATQAVQAKSTAGTVQASDKTARDVQVIYKQGATEVIHVQSLPGAETPLDPIRRRELCASLARVYGGNAKCSDAQPDGNSASAMPSP